MSEFTKTELAVHMMREHRITMALENILTDKYGHNNFSITGYGFREQDARTVSVGILKEGLDGADETVPEVVDTNTLLQVMSTISPLRVAMEYEDIFYIDLTGI